jgi:YD repeat-containing protein
LVNGGSTSIISGGITKYNTGGKGLKLQELKLETKSQIDLSSFSFSNRSLGVLPPSGTKTNFSPDSRYKGSFNYSTYDNKGNITALSKDNDVEKVYIWGYNKNYPVAEIIGITLSQAQSVINDATIQSLSTTDADMRTELNKIRTSFPAAHVMTYTYDPLIGMTSITDVNNITTFYEYDSFKRLTLIRDKDNKILKKICYNYAGQPGSCN